MKQPSIIVNNNLAAAVKEVNRVYISRSEIKTAIRGEINRILYSMNVDNIVADIHYGTVRMGSISPKYFKKFVGRYVSEWDNLIATDSVCREFKFAQDGCVFTVTDIRKTGSSNLNFRYVISIQEDDDGDDFTF